MEQRQSRSESGYPVEGMPDGASSHATHPGFGEPSTPAFPQRSALIPGVRIPFEVEGSLRVGAQAYVLARRLVGHEELAITPGSTLADVPLAECLEFPHTLTIAATRFEERTVFCLARSEDLPRFPKHARVDLQLG